MTTIHVLGSNPIRSAARAETVRRMAEDLVRFECFAVEADAIRGLFGRYPPLDIIVLLDDARQLAMQEVVAAAMMEV